MKTCESGAFLSAVIYFMFSQGDLAVVVVVTIDSV
jgi:hypothetical protein